MPLKNRLNENAFQMLRYSKLLIKVESLVSNFEIIFVAVGLTQTFWFKFKECLAKNN
jgi:hypothetical protein